MIKNKTENNFDFIRLLLAVFVYFGHWNILTKFQSENIFFNLHSHSVNLFFIISGFLIFWSFENDQNNKNFFIKRFFRIFPLYFIIIIFQTLFFLMYSDGSLFDIVKYFILNTLFLNFLAPTVGSVFGTFPENAINGSLWTLKNEVIFYAMVPFLFYIYKKCGSKIFFTLYIFSVIYMFIIDYLGLDKLNVQYPAQLRLFLIGILLYIFFDKLKKVNLYFLSTFAFVLLYIFNHYKYFYFIFYPLCIGVLVVFLVFVIKIRKINFDFSYSFYILHFPVIQLFQYFGINPNDPVISFFVIFIVIVILSYISELYIEKRFIYIGKILLEKKNNENNS